MKIQLIANHPVGKPITVVCRNTGKRADYDFVDDGTGARIAKVTEPGHISRMLDSPDVWRPYDPEEAAETAAAAKEASEKAAAESAAAAQAVADREAADKKTAAEKAAAEAAASAGSGAPAPAPAETPVPPAPPAAKKLEDMTHEELRAYAVEKYDRKFHPNAKSASILAEIKNLGG